MFDVIERLKADWTDKYVVIDSAAPELARFARTTGQVKTVNMNGRCLVEFDQYNNIGWYDIDPAALKIVPKPAPKPPEEKPAKPAPAAKAAPAKAAPPAGGQKPSTADILAAARRAAGATAAAPKPAGARPSTAEILAAARGKQPSAAGSAPPPPSAQPEPEPAAAEPDPTVAPKAKPPAGGSLPTTTAEKIAWCRARDAKG